MIITSDDLQGISALKTFLSKQFKMKDLGRLNYFLGIEVSSDQSGYYLSQASLVYLTVTHPDNAYAVHIVSQFMSAPRTTHYAVVLRIIRYVKGTLFHGLHYSNSSSLQLIAYSDADWAGDPTDRRSTTGYFFFLGDSLISWCSKKQTVISRSSTEAEYRAPANTTSELLCLRCAIQIAHNDVFHERTKHIETDCHFFRHHVLEGTVRLVPVPSQDQSADIFTKADSPLRFRALVSKLQMIDTLPS
ncbi:PREDICTED: uncharacterized protein LOC109115502 [Nelumbo nucifera]|uniref:Uncharacterized protein LOC109115502 n=1 Tax=Nelumbo nucifera TaxID=4432 RepID=A0A1U8Q9D1_NELNU|nr:PREDICTED: uncharacterized protein LOC109115502 [Nelumbo nucifera]